MDAVRALRSSTTNQVRHNVSPTVFLRRDAHDATGSSHRRRRRRGPPCVGQQSQLGAQPHAARRGGRPLRRRQRALPRRRPRRQPGPGQPKPKGLIFLKTGQPKGLIFLK